MSSQTSGAPAANASPALTVWTVPSLAAGSATLTIAATVVDQRASTNTAEVMAVDQADPNSTPGDGTGDDRASVTVRPQRADLSLAKAVDRPTPAVGQEVTLP